MKKDDEMRAEYRREDIGKGVRGKHYAEFKKLVVWWWPRLCAHADSKLATN